MGTGMTMADVGKGNVQIGQAGGPVVVNQVTLHIQNRPVVQAEKKQRLTVDRRELLRLMRRTGKEQTVVKWMETTFGTSRVLELTDGEVFRARRYCETIIERSEIKMHEEIGA